MSLDYYARKDDPEWLVTAFAERGIIERSPGDNPRIVEYHSHTGLGATDDETPWCSSFCCFVMDKHEFTSTKSAASLSWLRWGRVIDKPVRGCIVIFSRSDAEGNILPNRGHCGFWLGDDAHNVHVLGGNQSNSVNVSLYRKDRVLGYRWPAKATNSTTNMASITAAAGTVTAVAPTVSKMIDSVEESTDTVLSFADRITGLLDRVLTTPDSLLAGFGSLITLAALWYIIKERNRKIKRLGV